MVFSDYLDFGSEITGVKEGIPPVVPPFEEKGVQQTRRKRGTADGKGNGGDGQWCYKVALTRIAGCIPEFVEAWVKESPCGPPFEEKGGQQTRRKRGTADAKGNGGDGQ